MALGHKPMRIKCDGCKKIRNGPEMVTCNCCYGMFCIVGEPSCADKHEESGE